MSRVYESLKNTLSREDVGRISPAPVRAAGLNFNEATNAFQTLDADLLSALKAVSNEIETIGAEQRRQHDTIIQLKEKITALQVRIRAAEKAAQNDDPTAHTAEQQVISEIDALDYEIQKRAELPKTPVAETTLGSEISPQAAQRMGFEGSHSDKLGKEAINLAALYSVSGGDLQRNQDDHFIAMHPGDVEPHRERDLLGTTVEADFETGKRYVSQLSFQRFTGELVEIIGPIAPLVIREHIARLAESIHRFPKDRLSELLELVVSEFERESTRTRFRQSLAKIL